MLYKMSYYPNKTQNKKSKVSRFRLDRTHSEHKQQIQRISSSNNR